MPAFSAAAQLAFSLAAAEAQGLDAPEIDTEHLALGLLKLDDVRRLDRPLPQIDADTWGRIQGEVREYVEGLETSGLQAAAARRRLRTLLRERGTPASAFTGHRTRRGRAAFARAERLARDLESAQVGPAHLLAAVMAEDSTVLEALLAESGRTCDQIILAVVGQRGLRALHEKPDTEPAVESLTPTIDRFGRDLSRLARERRLDPVIGRRDEMRRVAQILSQKGKNNPVLLGEAGVGKTRIVEGLALRAAADDAPEPLRGWRFVELPIATLVAGTKYRGEFEERMEAVLSEVCSDPNLVLFLDELHTLVGAGAGSEGSLDAANILKPALARGDLKCIGATTPAEYSRRIEKDAALTRRFQPVFVEEPTPEQTLEILQGVRRGLEEFHDLRIPDAVLETTLKLCLRYLPDARFPDKAVDALDQACARRVLRTLSPAGLAEAGMAAAGELSERDVAAVVADRARLPVETLTFDEGERLLQLPARLGIRVLGQAPAISAVCETLRAAGAGLRDPKRPRGVFLFVGATGTGKTELARALAEELFGDARRLVAIDMSEYQEKHSVARLLGAPPGYVGHEGGGQLVERVRQSPYCVLLFDEVEKAHPDVFDLFLQMFEEGRVTDAAGRIARLQHAVIVLTSNLGTIAPPPKKALGFRARDGGSEAEGQAESEAYVERIAAAMHGTFRRELLNRIDRQVVFRPLPAAVVQDIAGQMLARLNDRLHDRGVSVEASPEALAWLADAGTSDAYGARELSRVIERHVSEPLSCLLLEGRAGRGARVRVRHEGEGLLLELETTAGAAPGPSTRR